MANEDIHEKLEQQLAQIKANHDARVVRSKRVERFVFGVIITLAALSTLAVFVPVVLHDLKVLYQLSK